MFQAQKHRRGGREILRKEETKYSLFDVESSPGSSPFATGSRGVASAVVSHERIVAPNGAGFMIYEHSLRRCGTTRKLSASGDCEYRVVRVRVSKTEKSTSTAFYLVRFQEATLDDTAPEDPEMSRLLDRPFTQRMPRSPPLGDWIPVRIFNSLFMKLFFPALTNQKQLYVGPKPHLFP